MRVVHSANNYSHHNHHNHHPNPDERTDKQTNCPTNSRPVKQPDCKSDRETNHVSKSSAIRDTNTAANAFTKRRAVAPPDQEPIHFPDRTPNNKPDKVAIPRTKLAPNSFADH